MSLRIRTAHIDAIKPLTAAPIPANFIIPDVTTHDGYLLLDIFAALFVRVRKWNIQVSGALDNSSAFFTTSTTFSGAENVTITPNTPPSVGDESFCVYGMEDYAIRDTADGIGDLSGSTALTMVGAGIALEPNAPPALGITPQNRSGPVMSQLTTQVTLGVEQGTGFLDLRYICTFEAPGLPPDEAVIYRVFMQLQTSPVGHDDGFGGTTTPVPVGTLTIRIPNWLDGGNNEKTVVLYADTENDNTWLTGNFDYNGDGITGTVDMVMTPAGIFDSVWPYEDSASVAAWDNDGNLLVPYATLETGEPR